MVSVEMKKTNMEVKTYGASDRQVSIKYEPRSNPEERQALFHLLGQLIWLVYFQAGKRHLRDLPKTRIILKTFWE